MFVFSYKSGSKNLNQRGFSLIELLIVILVVAILVTLSIPQIQQTLKMYRLDVGERLVSNRLLDARLSAIKRNRDAWLVINSSARTLQVASTDDNGATVYLSPSTTLPENVYFSSTTPPSVIFNSLGRNKTAGTSSVSLQLTKSSSSRTIAVSATGNITGTN
jgi:prepilin-type N-terminal cleavage/methylation domain-containing protein